MSVAPSEPQHEPTESPSPTPRPETTPRLPVVELRSEEPRLQVFFSAKASAAAAQAARRDEFYDVRGIALTRVGSDNGSPRLEARGEEHPDELRERLMDELRTAGELAVAGGAEATEVEAVLHWLADAPTLEYLVHGLGLAPLDYGDEPAPPSPSPMPSPQFATCHHCSWLQKFFGTGHNCC
jgi:hypothetical protein